DTGNGRGQRSTSPFASGNRSCPSSSGKISRTCSSGTWLSKPSMPGPPRVSRISVGVSRSVRSTTSSRIPIRYGTRTPSAPAFAAASRSASGAARTAPIALRTGGSPLAVGPRASRRRGRELRERLVDRVERAQRAPVGRRLGVADRDRPARLHRGQVRPQRRVEDLLHRVLRRPVGVDAVGDHVGLPERIPEFLERDVLADLPRPGAGLLDLAVVPNTDVVEDVRPPRAVELALVGAVGGLPVRADVAEPQALHHPGVLLSEFGGPGPAVASRGRPRGAPPARAPHPPRPPASATPRASPRGWSGRSPRPAPATPGGPRRRRRGPGRAPRSR